MSPDVRYPAIGTPASRIEAGPRLAWWSESGVPVHTGAASPFVEFLCEAIKRAGTVRCVFHDSPENRRMIGEIRMMHLDRQSLGKRFTDESLSFIPAIDHIGMMSTGRLLELLDLIVTAVEDEPRA